MATLSAEMIEEGTDFYDTTDNFTKSCAALFLLYVEMLRRQTGDVIVAYKCMRLDDKQITSVVTPLLIPLTFNNMEIVDVSCLWEFWCIKKSWV